MSGIPFADVPFSGATISECGQFRYLLWRKWERNPKFVTFVMLNPSTADGSVDDPTIRRCIGFAKSWGYGGIMVVNLFAFRATRPDDLKDAGWLVGPRNDEAIMSACVAGSLVVCAWGANARKMKRADDVRELIRPWATSHVLGLTDDGIPRHPLYLAARLQPVVWS